MHTVDQRRLHYFVALAEILHFRKAAERLHITQPALSHHIKALEEEIREPLFHRIGHTVQLTACGQIYKEHALRALKEMEDARAAIKEVGGLLRGTLGIGVFQSFNSHLLPPILAKFYRQYPGIRVTVHQLPKRDMEDRILHGEMDLGIAYAPTISDKIEAEDLFDDPCALIVGKQHPLSNKGTLTLHDLIGIPLVLVTPEFPLRQLLDISFAKAAIKPKVVMELNATEAILEIVMQSELATIMSARRPTVKRGIKSIELEPCIARRAAIFRRKGGHQSKAAVALAELIKHMYGDHSANAT